MVKLSVKTKYYFIIGYNGTHPMLEDVSEQVHELIKFKEDYDQRASNVNKKFSIKIKKVNKV